MLVQPNGSYNSHPPWLSSTGWSLPMLSFYFHRNEPHDFWSHTSKVDPDDSHGNQEPHIWMGCVSKEIIALSINAVLVIGNMGFIVN